jgi:hypothetical protein
MWTGRTVALDGGQGLALPLLDALRGISAILSNVASRDDIAPVAAECTASMLPDGSISVVQVSNHSPVATVLASINSPFTVLGESLPSPTDAIIRKASQLPQQSHAGDKVEVERQFPASFEYAGEDDIVVCKAVTLSATQPIVLCVVTTAKLRDQTENVLMTMSELLTTFCTCHEAIQLLDQS